MQNISITLFVMIKCYTKIIYKVIPFVSSFLIDEKEYHKFLERQISGREKRKQVRVA